MSDPILSVLVVMVSDTNNSRRDAGPLCECLEALARQVDSPSMEIIVPYLTPVQGLERVRDRFPEVNFVPVDLPEPAGGRRGSREHHDQLRAIGLGQARGEIVALLEDHARPAPAWAAQAVATHRQHPEYAGVGGAIENDIDQALNWAVYFCDFAKYQNPVRAGESDLASDANVAYKRASLESIRPVWQQVFRETAVNWALRQRGAKLALSPEMIVYQHRRNLRLADALKERFIWGSSYALARSDLAGGTKRWGYALLAPALPFVLTARMTANALRKKRHSGVFLRVLPLIVLLTTAWACGELAGDLQARPADPLLRVPQAGSRA